jgi:death-on-curing protein
VTRYLTPEELLQVAEQIPGDPEFDDIGVLDAAACRVQAHYMGQDVYGSTWLKAAALMQTIALHEPLERDNVLYAWLAGETFLRVNGRAMEYKPADARTLIIRTGQKDAGVREIAAQLRAWATT